MFCQITCVFFLIGKFCGEEDDWVDEAQVGGRRLETITRGADVFAEKGTWRPRKGMASTEPTSPGTEDDTEWREAAGAVDTDEILCKEICVEVRRGRGRGRRR